MDLDFWIAMLGIIGPLVFNFYFLYNRKKAWILSKLRWYITGFLALIGGLILLLFDFENIDGRSFLSARGLVTPFIFSLMISLFSGSSKMLHNRDFYLWLRYSSEIDDSKLSGGKHVKVSDRIISMFLIFFVMFLPFSILIIKAI